MSKSVFSIRRTAMLAVLIAVYAVIYSIPFLNVEIAGVKLCFAMLAITIAAMLYGPVDGLLVGLLGELLYQVLWYGLTPTTPLWILHGAVRGAVLGLGARWFREALAPEKLFRQREAGSFALYLGICLVGAVLASVFNTLAYYADSKLYGYYSYALIFGVAGWRIVVNMINSTICAVLALPIMEALTRAGLYTRPETTKKEGLANENR